MEPLISVIVPVYNVEEYLPRCLESILVQTYSNLQIILVNDGSKDNSGRVCDEYNRKDSRIQVIHKENGGVGSARNRGLEISAGEYLTFVDPDDYLSSDAVQVLYERLNADKSDMAVAKHIDIYDDGREDDFFCKWIQDCVISPEDVYVRMGEKPYFSSAVWGKLYKKKLFENVKFPDLCCGEDMWICPILVDRCERISLVNQTIYYYYQRPNSILHHKSERAWYDDVKANVNFASILWTRGFISGARHMYSRTIDKAYMLEDKSAGIALIENHLDHSARKALRKGLGMKMHIKWLCLYSPILCRAIQFVKRLRRRIKC